MTTLYGLWISGGATATIEATSEREAVCAFLKQLGIKESPVYCGGRAIGSNPAYYTAQHGDEIKVWVKNEEKEIPLKPTVKFFSHSVEVVTDLFTAAAPLSGGKAVKFVEWIQDKTEKELKEHNNRIHLITSHVSLWFNRGDYFEPMFSYLPARPHKIQS